VSVFLGVNMRGTGRHAMLFYYMSENLVCDALTFNVFSVTYLQEISDQFL
jgi:hypothetical protein